LSRWLLALPAGSCRDARIESPNCLLASSSVNPTAATSGWGVGDARDRRIVDGRWLLSCELFSDERHRDYRARRQAWATTRASGRWATSTQTPPKSESLGLVEIWRCCAATPMAVRSSPKQPQAPPSGGPLGISGRGSALHERKHSQRGHSERPVRHDASCGRCDHVQRAGGRSRRSIVLDTQLPIAAVFHDCPVQRA
jgi:hypothetical protein